MSHLIIKHQRPYQIVAVAVLISLLVSIAIWLYLNENLWTYINSAISQSRQNQLLLEEKHNLEIENDRLRERMIMLERTAQIDSQAAAEIHEEMKGLQNEIYKLKGELEFYQNIVSATSSNFGLNIQGMQLEGLSIEKNFHFKLILTHMSKSDKLIEGVAEISLEGLQEGVTRVLNIMEIVSNPAFDLSFKFRNFKRIEGNIILPEGFIPHRIIVKLHPKDTKSSNIKRIFNWSDVIS